MKTVQMFLADDGKMFDNAQECVTYEKRIPSEDKLVELSSYSLQDDCIKLNNIQDVKEFLAEGQSWLETLADDAWNGF